MPQLQHSESFITPSVVFRDVSKAYFTESFGIHDSKQVVNALKEINFVVRSGESVGIIGQNGSGKSTMLRLLSGAESPTKGKILVSSRPTLLGVSAALVPYLSGERNIWLGCLAMGMQPTEVEQVFDDIVQMADIGNAIHRPLKTYSSGMGARLAFAIGTAATPQILLVDEALSTGDSAFRAKAKERMNGLINRAGTVFVVSHDAKTIEDICERVIWLHDGAIIADTEAWIACEQYGKWSFYRSKKGPDRANEFIEEVKSWYHPPTIELKSES